MWSLICFYSIFYTVHGPLIWSSELFPYLMLQNHLSRATVTWGEKVSDHSQIEGDRWRRSVSHQLSQFDNMIISCDNQWKPQISSYMET